MLNARACKIGSQHGAVNSHHFSTSTAGLKDDEDAAYTVNASEASSSVELPQANTHEETSINNMRMQKDVDVTSIAQDLLSSGREEGSVSNVIGHPP